MFRLFEHTADMGIRVEAPDLETLFEEAAEALFSVIVEEMPSDAPTESRELRIEGRRHDYLLFDWLNELLYRFDVERLLFGKFAVELGEGELRGRAEGWPLEPERQRLLREVKAITYHRLRVEPREPGWIAEVIVDI